MSEKALWSCMKKALDEKGAFYQRITDALAIGIPDVVMVYAGLCCFVELKQINAFPTREATPVRIGYKQAQRAWAKKCIGAGGTVFLLVQVGRRYYLFDWIHAMGLIADERLDTARFIHFSTECRSMQHAVETIIQKAKERNGIPHNQTTKTDAPRAGRNTASH
jgi:hypothetical protein